MVGGRCESTCPRGRYRAATKVIMSKFSYSKTLLLWLAGLGLVLAQSISLLAQEASTVAFDHAATESALAQPVEIASAAALPSAPSAVVLADGRAYATSMEPIPMAPVPVVGANTPAKLPETHRFWDRENTILFAAAGAAATADFFTTRANLASGGRELNPVTRVLSGSTPGLAANFVLETSGVMAISYMFHKTGHHTLERFTSLVNIGASAGAVVYGQTHR